MATFIAVGYGDQAGYNGTDDLVRVAAHTHDARLREAGTVMGTAGEPVQVRNHDAAGAWTVPGPFMRSELPVAGFAVLEASDIDEAARLLSETPCAVAHGVVEIWPLTTH